MFGIFADNPHNPFALDNFALITDLFNRGSNLHPKILFLVLFLAAMPSAGYLQSRQYFRAVVSNSDRMFKMCRHASVDRYRRPTIV